LPGLNKKRKLKKSNVALDIWWITSAVFGAVSFIYITCYSPHSCWLAIISAVAALLGSLPILLLLLLLIPYISFREINTFKKKTLLVASCFCCCAIYGSIGVALSGNLSFYKEIEVFFTITGLLFGCTLCALLISSNKIAILFNQNNQSILKQYTQMETITNYNSGADANESRPNKILLKALITGGLILAMLLPTIFISNLVSERQSRQEEVVKEVSDRWAKAQVLTGPYVYLPYKIISIDKNKKLIEETRHMIIIPDKLEVSGKVFHEMRVRSIYKVLLYKASLQHSGSFEFKIPKEIEHSLILWKDAKICYGLSDFKGIEEKQVVNFNGLNYELSPGLPSDEISEKGMSAQVPLSNSDEGRKLAFSISLKIKGSEQLHFVPLSGDSHYTLKSTWSHPSFDGNNLPTVRTVNDSGFTATWNFNKANLPFGTILKDFKYDLNSLAFGVTMIQTADGYAKTNRCIKYGILFIGLTFSLFFIIEVMQKKPVHPVQYILVGVALIIFFTLLLSISEYINFDLSYLIAALAIILLITSYAYGHFKSGKTAGIFAGILTLLYTFIFLLIRLEDTALLVGSIGLFFILALTMYASRKINWYGSNSMSLNVDESI
jgi:inner membrane protein